MGAGRKTKTLHLKEKGETSWSTNCSAPARNLRKSDLGAVIFVCNQNTFKECHSELLFGLPAPHFAYVKKIDPGLTLFLFNYSERRLYGIYEATSKGQLNISPYGWTADHADYTPYPAQVKIKIRTQCSPLTEDEYKPIISENYHEPKVFWLELDRTQTHNLIAQFTSRVSVSRPRKMAIHMTAFPTSSGGQRSDDVSLVSRSSWTPLDNVNMGSGNALDSGLSYAQIVSGKSTSLPENPISSTERKWSSLFESSTMSSTTKTDESEPRVSEVNCQEYGIELGSSSSLPSQKNGEEICFEAQYSENHDAHNQAFEAHNAEWGSGNYFAEFRPDFGKAAEEQASQWVDDGDEWEHYSEEALAPSGSHKRHDNNFPSSYGCHTDDKDPSALGETSYEIAQEEILTDTDKFLHTEERNSECSYSSAVEELDPLDYQEESTESSTMAVKGNEFSSGMVAIADTASPDVQALLLKLMKEVDELKVSDQTISDLKQELVESKAEIEFLRTRLHKLESKLLPSMEDVEESMTEPSSESCLVNCDPIFIIGGFDGSSWLSDLCSYVPYQDSIRPLAPMSTVHGYSSALTMNRELYVLGGGHDDMWHDIVESYNPATDEWSNRPPLNQKRGSLSGASLFDKIYAIGGGNGRECFSSVEMLDMDIGKWIPVRSMAHKRFAPAAAELNGAIYVVGGYNGRNYLESAERFDPREHSWRSLTSMGTKRGCHSLVVLNDKLYALGGYNGAEIVSTIEVLDPRMGSWMMGQSMNISRGYCGAAVLGDKLHVIGGITENNVILDSIEIYEESHGWQMTNLKGVGKRCFFSAVVF